MAKRQSNFYDYIVVGCGGVGSATLYWLTKRTNRTGARVLGLEQFKLGHDNGGSQDMSRIIRLSYHEDYYTALARGAYEAWAEAERDSGEQLVFKTGGLNIGKKGTITEQVVKQYADALTTQGIPYEMLEGDALRQRFPQITADNLVAAYQKESGLVDAARGNSTHIQLAEANGATVLENAAVTRIGRMADGTVSMFGRIVLGALTSIRCRDITDDSNISTVPLIQHCIMIFQDVTLIHCTVEEEPVSEPYIQSVTLQEHSTCHH